MTQDPRSVIRIVARSSAAISIDTAEPASECWIALVMTFRRARVT